MKRWLVRLLSGTVAGITAFGLVWIFQRARGVPDPFHFRVLLAGGVGSVLGVLGRMFADEVMRQ